MRKFFAIFCMVVAFALTTPGGAVFATENPCGNHGNHCCTDDGGESYDSVSSTCSSFCESTAAAVAVAVSECSATCSATCSVEVGSAVAEAAASCSTQINEAVNEVTASCSVPACLDWKIKRNKYGQVTRRICKKVLGQ